MRTFIPFSIFIVYSIFLTSCSDNTHSNPLESTPSSLSGYFIYQASRYAEAQLGFGQAHSGIDFKNCIEGHDDITQEYCEQLYANMLEYAKKQNNAFKTLILDDLLDSDAYFRLKDDYSIHFYMGK